MVREMYAKHVCVCKPWPSQTALFFPFMADKDDSDEEAMEEVWEILWYQAVLGKRIENMFQTHFPNPSMHTALTLTLGSQIADK